jgi:hypothetical protein
MSNFDISESLNNTFYINKQWNVLAMNDGDTERLNYLSEKNVNDTITADELEELSALLNDWNLSVETKQLKHL